MSRKRQTTAYVYHIVKKDIFANFLWIHASPYSIWAQRVGRIVKKQGPSTVQRWCVIALHEYGA